MDILQYAIQFNPNVKFLFENVSSMSKESKQAIEECLGVELVYQNSSAFSAQDRGRVYGTNFPFKPVLNPSNILLKDVLENDVDEKYFYNCKFDFLGFDKTVCATLHINGHDILKRVNSPFAKCQTLTTCGGGNTQKKVLDNGRPRKLTPLEYERLQTLPDGYTDGFADSHRYNTIGNGWTVDVIAHILKALA